MKKYLTSQFFLIRALLILVITCFQCAFLPAQNSKEPVVPAVKLVLRYNDTLLLDFYKSETMNPTQSPLIILVHGGGFYTGKRDGELETEFCETMSSLGYAVASISYRLTRKDAATGFGCECPAETKIETFKKSVEDLFSAVSFLAGHKDLQFDRDHIILVGSSAGAEAVLQAAFMTDFPGIAMTPEKPEGIAGVISFAGAVLDTAYIGETNKVPSLLFHGTDDKLVPYEAAPHHFCDETDPGYLELYGGSVIAERLNNLGTSYTLVTAPGGGHEWANIPYKQTAFIHQFIEKVIIGGNFQQVKLSAEDLN